MKSLLPLLLLAAIPSRAQVIVKPPVWQCWVNETDGVSYVYTQIAKDGNFVTKPFYHQVASMDDVVGFCGTELAKAQSTISKPLVSGIVAMPSAVVDVPPPPPDPALTDFLNRVKTARELMGIVPADNKTLVTLIQGIGADVDAHPEWLSSL